MNAEAETISVLREIRDEIRALREAVETAREPERPPLKFQDRAAMARILPVLAEHFNGSFATWEILDHAEQADVLGANLRLVLGNRTAQELGKLFQRVQDHEIDGLTLRRAGSDANGALWECIGN